MFVHDPLVEPTKQFRLLSFDDPSTVSHLCCRLQVFELAACPAYCALSYVYGDPLLREPILVNGEVTYLNRNGWHTLQQARSRAAAGSYYWLDALCINQTDLFEKAIQVYKIADIFTGAAEIWAHLGPEQDDSGFLFQALASFPLGDPSCPIAEDLEERSDDMQRRTVNWLASLNNEFDRFADALKAIGHRPFFSRVWIYQELYLASRIFMICGTATADMQALRDVTHTCTTLCMSYRPHSDYDYKDAQVQVLNLMERADLFMKKPDDGLVNLEIMVHQIHRKDPAVKRLHYTRSGGLVDIQTTIQDLQCYDARDKIFAIISLLGSDYEIMPDYTISCFDLASQVLAQDSRKESAHSANRSLELAILLCVNLRLDLSVAEVKTAMARNLSSVEHSEMPECFPRSTMSRHRTGWGCKVSLTPSGQMTAPMITYETKHWPGILAPLATDSVSAQLESVTGKCLVVDGRVVAITACELSEGDWIVPLSDYSTNLRFETYCYGVILRAQRNTMYRVVGEVAFSPYCRPCAASSGEPESCQCVLESELHADSGQYFDIMFDSDELLLCATRLRAPFETMRRESHYRARAPPLLPSGPPMKWPSSFAVGHLESFRGEYTLYASTESLMKPSIRRSQSPYLSSSVGDECTDGGLET
jgi:hypothetical protein